MGMGTVMAAATATVTGTGADREGAARCPVPGRDGRPCRRF